MDRLRAGCAAPPRGSRRRAGTTRPAAARRCGRLVGQAHVLRVARRLPSTPRPCGCRGAGRCGSRGRRSRRGSRSGRVRTRESADRRCCARAAEVADCQVSASMPMPDAPSRAGTARGACDRSVSGRFRFHAGRRGSTTVARPSRRARRCAGARSAFRRDARRAISPALWGSMRRPGPGSAPATRIARCLASRIATARLGEQGDLALAPRHPALPRPPPRRAAGRCAAPPGRRTPRR